DEEEVSSDNNEIVEVKVLMALVEENNAFSKEGTRNGEWHVNTEILKENKNLRTELKEKRIMGVDQLTEDPSSSRQKDLVFVKSLADHTKVSKPSVERPWLSKAKDVTDSLAIEYDSADESSVCSTPLPPLKKLDGVEPISGPKTIKSILRSKSTFKAKTLKGVTIIENNLSTAKCDIRKPICDLKWCLEMTLQAQPKVMALSNVMFDEKRGTIFNSNKEVVMIAPRVRDVYVLDMTSSAQESCFFTKASDNLNWL
ncbi:hypothetical protein Tco_0271878, partial [Tanacetum coccineum]